MLLGKNLFRVSHDDYIRELRTFVATKVSPRAASIFCTLADAPQLMPFLRYLYHRETSYPAINMPRNERVERAIDYLLHNLDASVAEIATFLGTTENQVMRLSDITSARKTIERQRGSTST